MTTPRELVPISPELFADIREKKGRTMTELVDLTGISRNTLTRLEGGRACSMKPENARKLATALGVPLKSLQGSEVREIQKKNPMMPFMGLRQTPVVEPDTTPFCDWVITQNNQPLSHAWWSIDTDLLQLKIEKNTLRVTFKGHHEGLPPNYGVQPWNHVPRELSDSQNAIGVAVYAEKGSGLVVGMRLTDKEGKEWIYTDDSEGHINPPMHLFPLTEGKWTPCIVNLLAPKHRWRLFRTASADRISNRRPSFSVLSRVVFELGKGDFAGRPGPGEGTLLFSPIWVGTVPSLEKRLQSSKDRVATLTAGRKLSGQSKRRT